MDRTIGSTLQYRNESATTSLPLRMAAALVTWQRRITSRHQLARLDARLLADAGISECQRQAELRKPFWR